MAIHDWTRVDQYLFHDFHLTWAVGLSNALNGGVLPSDYFALLELRMQGPVPNVASLEMPSDIESSRDAERGLDVETNPPRTRLVRRTEVDVYARKENRITIRDLDGTVVAVIEIVSPGMKGCKSGLQDLVKSSVEFIRHGVHLLVIDILPPGKHDPLGIHKAIWDEFEEEDLELQPNKPLTLASYYAGFEHVAYVEMVGVGDKLPDMPLFLESQVYVVAPLEATYSKAWGSFPAPLKHLLETPIG